eukprot:2129761-Pyramimonas_sp.AAC.1
MHTQGVRWPAELHGFLPRRRREDAIAMQLCMGFRYRTQRIPHLNTLHDMTNAFASTTARA